LEGGLGKLDLRSYQLHRAGDRMFYFHQHSSWPGNVRELKNIIERAVLFAKDGIINMASLPPHIAHYLSGGSGNLNDEKGVNGARDVIIQTLERYNGNITQSAKALFISRPTLYKKMKEMNIHINIKLDNLYIIFSKS
jgi:transcriptional regulator of acetoin/glycerol metabolism